MYQTGTAGLILRKKAAQAAQQLDFAKLPPGCLYLVLVVHINFISLVQHSRGMLYNTSMRLPLIAPISRPIFVWPKQAETGGTHC